MKEYEITLDLKQNNSIELTGLVNGDTANVFNITITNDGVPYKLTDDNSVPFRKRFLISNKNGIGTQDSLLDDSGIYDTDLANGKFKVSVHLGMIADGYNHGRVEIYENSDYSLRSTTQPFNFEAAATYIVEKSPELPSLIAIEQGMLEALSLMSKISSIYVDANGDVHIVLENGTDTNIGSLTSLDTSVHYTPDTKTDAEKAQARTNIGAAVSTHTHGNLSNDGKVGSPSSLVETNSSGAIVANRKLVVGTTSPSAVSGLSAGDIYIRKATSVNREFEGDVKVNGKLTIGSTDLTEANLIALLELL